MEPRRRCPPAARPLVLIVDGHEDTRELYALALRFFGFDAVTEDGAGPLNRARETHPDIIVTEIALPQRDGWTFVDELKHDPQTSATPSWYLRAMWNRPCAHGLNVRDAPRC